MKNKNKTEISEIVYSRFHDRYLKPFSFANDDFKKNELVVEVINFLEKDKKY